MSTPLPEEAAEAQHYLEQAILKFSDEARAPQERGTPDPHPTWVPRISSLRYNPLRGSGWLWSMEADDPQIVAYYVTRVGSMESFGRVTAHGQARAGFHQMMVARRLHTGQSSMWYDFRKQYTLDEAMYRERESAG